MILKRADVADAALKDLYEYVDNGRGAVDSRVSVADDISALSVS